MEYKLLGVAIPSRYSGVPTPISDWSRLKMELINLMWWDRNKLS